MLDELLAALCLVFFLEGILPFVTPKKWRRMMQLVCSSSDHSLRVMGLLSMLFGLALLSVLRFF